jgi:hypothetical protein
MTTVRKCSLFTHTENTGIGESILGRPLFGAYRVELVQVLS